MNAALIRALVSSKAGSGAEQNTGDLSTDSVKVFKVWDLPILWEIGQTACLWDSRNEKET